MLGLVNEICGTGAISTGLSFNYKGGDQLNTARLGYGWKKDSRYTFHTKTLHKCTFGRFNHFPSQSCKFSQTNTLLAFFFVNFRAALEWKASTKLEIHAIRLFGV